LLPPPAHCRMTWPITLGTLGRPGARVRHIWSVVSTQSQQDAQVHGSIGVAADKGAAFWVCGVVVPLQPPDDLAFALTPHLAQYLARLIVVAGRVRLVHLDDGQVPGQCVLQCAQWRCGVASACRWELATVARRAPVGSPPCCTRRRVATAQRSATDCRPACTWNSDRRHLVLVFSLQMLPAWSTSACMNASSDTPSAACQAGCERGPCGDCPQAALPPGSEACIAYLNDAQLIEVRPAARLAQLLSQRDLHREGWVGISGWPGGVDGDIQLACRKHMSDK
jgi:hypothetical protein